MSNMLKIGDFPLRTHILRAIVFSLCFAFSITLLAGDKQHPTTKDHLRLLQIVQDSYSPDKLEEARDGLRGFATVEAYEAIEKRFRELPKDTKLLDHPRANQIVLILIELFEVVGTAHDLRMVGEVEKWVKENMPDDSLDRSFKKMYGIVGKIGGFSQRKFVTIAEMNKTLLDYDRKHGVKPDGDGERKTLTARPEAYAKGHKRALGQVREFYEAMAEKVVGQEEVLRSMEALYLKDVQANGRRLQPEVFYLMGLPGNGKDTIVESYVDALYNQEGAHDKHLFRINIRNKHEASSYFGSSKGYIGSDDLTELHRFLVEHSGGRYMLAVEEQGSRERVVVYRNPEWKPEMQGLTNGAHKAVIFINEAHNIPKDVKDNVLKQAIERGIFPITNPGQGANAVSEIKVNATFIFASNEGIELIEPREKNGTRIGEPLSHERLMENWGRVQGDKPALKQAILKNNGEVNDPMRGDGPGTSEEFLNRIPDQRVFMLRPLSPDNLFAVARLQADLLSGNMEKARGALGRYGVTLTDELVRFITEYNYIPSENARPIKGRLQGFVFEEIYKAIMNERIRPLGTEQQIKIDVKKYENDARSLVFEVVDTRTGEIYNFNRLIAQTLNDIPKAKLPQERVNEILGMRQQITENVFGVEHIVDRLVEAAIVSESEARNSGKSSRPATVMAFLGKTSTGKSETAKQYVRARYGDKEKPNIIDFNGVRSLEAMEAKILGSYDGRKNPIASDFMKAYDRAPDGNIAFIFDEAANSPKELLKALYEVLREPVVRGFSDGKPRSMKNVTIILTGNAGERIYDAVPRHLPALIHERALHEVFRLFLGDAEMQQRILAETFPEALIARLGRNIYHFGPLTNGGKRQVAQLKLLQGLETLKPKRSERGWKVQFANEENLLRAFDMIEKEGYHLSHQGASIDKFVREQLIDRIKARLLREGVPDGSRVMLDVDKDLTKVEDKGIIRGHREIRLTVENGKSFSIKVPLQNAGEPVSKTPLDRALVGYHEVGHEVVSEVYLGDRVKPKYVSIIDGVTRIGNAFIHYAGVRAGVLAQQVVPTREVLLRDVAVLTGGYVAQQIVTMGARHDTGKSNDLMRATRMIQDGILRGGLSDRWGMRSIGDQMTTQDFIEKELSSEEKQKLNEITGDWLKEAERLAREALFLNIDKLFIDMSMELNAKGFLDEKDIKTIYERSPSVSEHSSPDYQQRLAEVREVMDVIDRGLRAAGQSFAERFPAEHYSFAGAEEAFRFLYKKGEGIKGWFKKNPWNRFTENQRLVASAYLGMVINDPQRDARFSSDFWVPKKVADIMEFIENERKVEAREVTRFDRFQFMNSAEAEAKVSHPIADIEKTARAGRSVVSCHRIFAQPSH